jgi:N-acetylglucosaminyldiphosphoundecaprenol N-acetyl-beta-D-mannosaminyltransferase
MKNFFERMYSASYQEFEKELEKNLRENRKMFVVTANPETFMIGTNNQEVSQILLDRKVTIVPDGIGIVKGANMLGYKVKERIPGIEIAWSLLKLGNEQKKSIFLLGASEEVKEKMIEKLKADYPNLKILGAINGYGKNKDKDFERIKKENPDIILVALGIPAQEKLIYKHLDDFSKGIFVGVGGSLDVISGAKKRAPKIFQNLGLEWLYRLAKEPKRIKRFYNSNVKFIFEIKKLKKGKNNEMVKK